MVSISMVFQNIIELVPRYYGLQLQLILQDTLADPLYPKPAVLVYLKKYLLKTDD
jgi:hypothetical protein